MWSLIYFRSCSSHVNLWWIIVLCCMISPGTLIYSEAWVTLVIGSLRLPLLHHKGTKNVFFLSFAGAATLPSFHTCVGVGAERLTPKWYKDNGNCGNCIFIFNNNRLLLNCLPKCPWTTHGRWNELTVIAEVFHASICVWGWATVSRVMMKTQGNLGKIKKNPGSI